MGINVNIEIIDVVACNESAFVKPQSVYYMQNGIEKRWDVVEVHNSVAILIYNIDLDSFVLVKQFRPPVYLKNGNGYTYELCAGLIDKDGKDNYQIAAEEILEETGYLIDASKLKEVTSFYTSVGVSGGRQTLFYAQIDESMRVGDGGGIDNENIEVVYIKQDQIFDFIFDKDIATTPGLMFAMMWFKQNKDLLLKK